MSRDRRELELPLAVDRTDPSVRLARQGRCRWLVGVDEAGRGPLAGPVAAAAVLLEVGRGELPAVADSKALTHEARAALVPAIEAQAAAWAVALEDAQEIDALGIVGATMRAMARAVEQVLRGRAALATEVMVVVDGRETIPGLPWRQRAIIKADASCAVVAAASILAKERRDQVCAELEQAHPGYGFADHKGYGTTTHLRALMGLGPSPQHRRSFDPLKTFVQTGEWPPGLRERLADAS